MLRVLLSSEKPRGLSERALRILILFGWPMASKSSALPMLKLSSSFLVMARRREGSCTARSYFHAHRQRLDLGEGSGQCLLTVFSGLSVSPPFPTGLFHRTQVGLWNGFFAHD